MKKIDIERAVSLEGLNTQSVSSRIFVIPAQVSFKPIKARLQGFVNLRLRQINANCYLLV